MGALKEMLTALHSALSPGRQPRQPPCMLRRLPIAGVVLRILFFLGLSLHLTAQNAGGEAKEPSEAELKAKYDAAISKLPWSNGPGEAQLGDKATIPYGSEFRFLRGKDAVHRLEMSGNRVDGDEVLGMLENVTGKWWVVFQFDDVGYVKDDEKNDLKADELLESYKEGVEQDNERRDGSPTKVIGWHTPPRYDETSHNLEWAIVFETAGEKYVNHNVRVLGRNGLMKVVLVEDMENLEKTLPAFRTAMGTFKFQTGESYAEYRPGDKIAKYGLTALVAGGAALGAAKLGLFAKLAIFFKKGFKLIILGVAALGAALKKLFTRARRD